MHLLVGSAACFVAAVLYAWAYATHNRDTAPSWAKSQVFASAISLILVALAPIGTGFIALGLTEPFSALNMIGYVAAAAVIPVSVITIRMVVKSVRKPAVVVLKPANADVAPVMVQAA